MVKGMVILDSGYYCMWIGYGNGLGEGKHHKSNSNRALLRFWMGMMWMWRE